jgi:hypothetical protein
MDLGLKYPSWQGSLHAAILELDPGKLSEKLETAELAIFNRTQQLAQSDRGDELRAIADGLYIIRMLRNDRRYRQALAAVRTSPRPDISVDAPRRADQH